MSAVGGIFIQYSTWESDHRSQLKEYESIVDPEVRAEVDARLKEFQESSVQKEVLSLDCEMFETLVEDAVLDEQNDGVKVGLVCGDRFLGVYSKVGDQWWLVTRLWQRSEGDVDFVVYDVKFGSVSLSAWTYGYISDELNRGIDDAQSLVSSGTFSGRAIEELYISPDGVKIVGVLD